MVENPVNASKAAVDLNLSRTYISAVKKSLGITGRYFFLSTVKKFIKDNPEFRLEEIYPHKPKKKDQPTALTQPSKSSGRKR